MDKTVLVTGGNRGLGLAVARLLEQAGHQVLLTSRNVDRGREALRFLNHAEYFQLDVTEPASVEQCRTQVADYLDEHGRKLDVLINNAGSVFDDLSGEVDTHEDPLFSSVETLEQTLELNSIAPYRVIKSFLPLMNRERRSDIINVTSGMGSLTGMGTGAPCYRISKASLNALTVYLAASLSGTKIRVNSVCPGWVRTDLGGTHAPRSAEEGVRGMLWIVNEEPDINGKFIRDEQRLEF